MCHSASICVDKGAAADADAINVQDLAKSDHDGGPCNLEGSRGQYIALPLRPTLPTSNSAARQCLPSLRLYGCDTVTFHRHQSRGDV